MFLNAKRNLLGLNYLGIHQRYNPSGASTHDVINTCTAEEEL